jgi:hypothetical protein
MVGPLDKIWSDDKLAFEVWKYYGSIGGRDKDTMIKIVTWLLGLSAAIIAFHAKAEVKMAESLLLGLGATISILSAFTALLYGGYATWNWSIADRIAETYEWRVQSPNYRPFENTEAHWTARVPLRLAEPCTNRIAPVFWMFFAASLVSFLAHVLLLTNVSCR